MLRLKVIIRRITFYGSIIVQPILENYLDWIPVRLFAFSFSLMSHFIPVLKSWLKDVLSGVQKNAILLANCGFTALDRERHSKHTTAEGIQQHVSA